MIAVGSVVTIKSDLSESMKNVLRESNFPPAGVPAIVVYMGQVFSGNRQLLNVEFEGYIGVRQLYLHHVELYKSEILT